MCRMEYLDYTPHFDQASLLGEEKAHTKKIANVEAKEIDLSHLSRSLALDSQMHTISKGSHRAIQENTSSLSVNQINFCAALPGLYKALLYRSAARPSELTIYKDDRVVVVHVFSDGWCQVYVYLIQKVTHDYRSNIGTNESGMCPLNCLERLATQELAEPRVEVEVHSVKREIKHVPLEIDRGVKVIMIIRLELIRKG